eukprot:1858329-Prorocentrum_lima.AAC.1
MTRRVENTAQAMQEEWDNMWEQPGVLLGGISEWKSAQQHLMVAATQPAQQESTAAHFTSLGLHRPC